MLQSFPMRADDHPLYSTWEGMNQRCNNPNHKAYRHYGGRGIKICRRWRSFWEFAEDMGTRPEGHSIDRINQNGNYSRSNCRWATQQEQLRNQRPRETSRSGTKGVIWFHRTNRWMAGIQYQGKCVHLGYYKELADAKAIRLEAERELWLGSKPEQFLTRIKAILASRPNAGNFKWRPRQQTSKRF